MTHVNCRLTAKNRDQLQNPTLGSRVWATFTFFVLKSRQPDTVTLQRGRTRTYLGLPGWRRGVVVSGVRRMNEVNTRRARLVPGWVTVIGRVYHLDM